jgi:hypothetical protein
MYFSSQWLLVLAYLLVSLANLRCGGYVLGKRSNPFFVYRVESVTVPLARNDTPIAELGAMVGQEVVQMLAQFPDLKVATGEDKSTDAVLFSVISSSPSLYQTVRNTQYLSSNSIAPINTGSRDPFLIPSANEASMTVNFQLVTREGKLLWTKTLPFNARYTVELYDEEGANVTHTQTMENARRSYRQSARALAENLKNLVIDAF